MSTGLTGTAIEARLKEKLGADDAGASPGVQTVEPSGKRSDEVIREWQLF